MIFQRFLLSGVVSGFLAAAVPAMAAPIDFIVDDGTSDIAFGNFSGTSGNVLILNQFDAGGGALIDEISYVMGTPAAGGTTYPGSVTVVLYEDNDDNGLVDNATLLLSIVDAPANLDNDIFNSVLFAPTLVTGIFFVGVFATGVDMQGVVGGDTNDPPGPSSIFAGTALSLANVAGTADIFAFEPEFTGRALIRASGESVTELAEPGPLALMLGAFGVMLLWRRCR